MKYAAVTERLNGLGGQKWAVHMAALERAKTQPVVIASIGEAEVPASPVLLAGCIEALQQGRTGYASGQGEAELLDALAERYRRSCGRAFGPENFLCVPGTQTALYLVLRCLLNPGDGVLVGDPFYVTYEAVIAAQEGRLVPVPLNAKQGFKMQRDDAEAVVDERCRVLLVTSPHNPTGAILGEKEIDALGRFAIEHDLWIVADEVYEDLVFDSGFHSFLAEPTLAERTIVVSSISKSHAAPGMRSGWVVGPEAFVQRALPVSETLLFGNQPFIADATARALRCTNTTAAQLRSDYQRRARRLQALFHAAPSLQMHCPEAGMFVMLDVQKVADSGEQFAWRLLREQNISVMPGEAFGRGGAGYVRISLTVSDEDIEQVGRGILALVRGDSQ